MMKKITFESFLEDKFMDSSYSDGVSKEQCEDAFNNWMSELDVQELIDYAQEAIDQAQEEFMKALP